VITTKLDITEDKETVEKQADTEIINKRIN
jgi:hypothetical protein